MKTLRKCARINNKTVDPSIYEEFQVCITFSSPLELIHASGGCLYHLVSSLWLFNIQAATQRTYQLEKDNPTNWMDLFRSPKMRKRFLLITLTWSVFHILISFVNLLLTRALRGLTSCDTLTTSSSSSSFPCDF